MLITDKKNTLRFFLLLILLPIFLFFVDSVHAKDINFPQVDARLITIDDICTLSVMAHNDSNSDISLSFGNGLQSDFVITDRTSNKTKRWSEGGSVYSFAKAVSLSGGMTRVFGHFTGLTFKNSHRYELVAELHVLGADGKAKILSGQPIYFSVDAKGEIVYAASGLELEEKKSDKTTKPITTQKQPIDDDVFVYEGKGGTEWNVSKVSPNERLQISDKSTSDIDQGSPELFEKFEEFEKSENDESDSTELLDDNDAGDTNVPSDQVSGNDLSDTSRDEMLEYTVDAPQTENLVQNDEGDTDGITIVPNSSGGSGSSAAIWRDNSIPLLWISSGNIWYVSDRIGSNSNTGTSSGSPFKTIKHALSRAGVHDLISIGPGNYDEGGLEIVKEIKLLGSGGAFRTFVRNTATNSRIFRIDSNAVLEGISILDHTSTDNSGGGVLLQNNCNAQIIRCRIVNNTGKNGAAVNLSANCELGMYDSLVSDNLAIKTTTTNGYGGAFYLQSNNQLYLENVTIADNFSENRCGGLYIANGLNTDIEIVNSIFWGNRDLYADTTEPSNISENNEVSLEIQDSCFEGSSPSGFGTIKDKGGNISLDPQFVNRYKRDYRLGFDKNGNMSPCVDTGKRLQLNRNGNEDDMGCFFALKVLSNDSFIARIDDFGELNDDILMGGSILLAARTYDQLASGINKSYKLQSNEATGRDFNNVLIAGSSIDSVVIKGDNDFSDNFNPIFSIKDSDVRFSDIHFRCARQIVSFENDEYITHELAFRNCLFEIGQEDALSYIYSPNGEAVRTKSANGSPIIAKFINNTFVHGSTSELYAMLYMDDADSSDSCIWVNNIDVARSSSDYVADDWRSINVASFDRIILLENNNTWEGQGLIASRETSPVSTRTYDEMDTLDTDVARNNYHEDAVFADFDNADYHLKLNESDLIDSGVERKIIGAFNDVGDDYVDINKPRFDTLDLEAGDKIKLVNTGENHEEFNVISDINRTNVLYDRITLRNELEYDYIATDNCFLSFEYCLYRNEEDDNGDTVNVGAYGNTVNATKSSE